MQIKNLTIWYQIVVKDAQLLTGKSVADFIGALANVSQTKICRVISEEWLYNLVYNEEPLYGSAINIAVFQNLIKRVSQIDWATVLLFHTLEEANKNDSSDESILDDSLIDAIGKSSLAVRMVDNSYFYVYTIVNSKIIETFFC